jgi:acyl-CoA thioesterase
MPSEFEADTHVEGTDGRYQATVSDRWSIGGRPNGGYIQALIVNAISAEVDHPDLITSTAHFLSPTAPGPATVEVEVLKRGRSFSNSRAQLIQNGQIQATVLANHGTLDGFGRTQHFDVMPTVSHLVDVSESERPFEINWRFQYLVEPGLMKFERSEEADPSFVAMIRFADSHRPTTTAFPLLVDAFPPTTVKLGVFGWAPTLELTVHGRARPKSDWLTARLRMRYLIDGLFEEECELWDEGGQLVAQSRQLGKIPG